MVVANAAPQSLLDQHHSEGPAWFVAMDRNHDGAVTLAEFLLGREQFQTFDQNHDGQITTAEAAP